MQLRLESLDNGELNKIHEATLEVLEKTGIKMDSEAVRKLLAQHGAQVDGNRVRLPSAMVERVVGQINRTVSLAARDGRRTLTLPSRTTLNATSGYAAQVRDMETGETRESTSGDLVQFAVLADALEEVDFFWPSAMPTEIASPILQEIAALDIALRHTSKHVQCSVCDDEAARWQIKLAAALLGGEDKLRETPIFSVVASPFTPLEFKKGVSDSLVRMARAGVPVTPMNVPMAGTTAPVTLAGAIVLTNAEQLATLAILKCADAAAPMVYSSDTATAEPSSGGMNYHSPDRPVLYAAIAQLTRFYGIPGCVAHDSSEEKSYQIAAGFEKNVLRVAMNSMSHSDLAVWMGSLDDALGCSLWDLVLDAEAVKMAKEYNRRFVIDDGTLAVDVIDQVGPGGHFMNNKHTAKNLRKQVSMYNHRNSLIFAGGDFCENARAKVLDVLKNHKPLPVDPEKIKAMDAVMEEARKIYG